GPSPIPTAATLTLATGPTNPPRIAARRVAIAAAVGLAAGLLAAWLARDAGRRTTDRLSRALLMPITRDSGVAESPAFTPDGETVVYSSDRTGDFEIYVRRASGGRELNITNDPADDVQPAVSPDGRLVAFVSTRASATNLTRI